MRPQAGAIRASPNSEMEQDQLIAFLLSPTYVKDPTMFAYVDDPFATRPYDVDDGKGEVLGMGMPRCESFFDPPSPANGELVSKEKRRE